LLHCLARGSRYDSYDSVFLVAKLSRNRKVENSTTEAALPPHSRGFQSPAYRDLFARRCYRVLLAIAMRAGYQFFSAYYYYYYYYYADAAECGASSKKGREKTRFKERDA